MKLKYTLIIFSILILGCSSQEQEIESSNNNQNNNTNNNNNNNSNNNWSIPQNEVFDGGVGKDGIPALENPNFLNFDDPSINDYMSDEDLVVGLVMGNQIKAYPHRILDWHEIVNDKFIENGTNTLFTINYCPLTGTAFTWRGEFEGLSTTFGVSGLLYNTNLILYDRETDSYWSQMKLECVSGKKLGAKVETVNVFETNWGTWKKLYPESKILSNVQEIDRDYSEYPYGPYKETHDFLLFPISKVNNALPAKTRVHALLTDTTSKAYTFNHFGAGKVIKDTFNGEDILLFGNQDIITSFKISNGLKDLNFSYSFDANLYTHFIDDTGNKWTLTGEAKEGPRKGTKLNQVKSVMSFWFTIGTFYESPTIYN